ncbi:protein YIPF1 [Neocloeon triangulifer]|uniref:protein YIPF1 n=1 Tax=Neocloeon triangulifer TaxID=2078957 RepID=UPI00286EBCA1|nr:protein YIPF1 [Neocloeon triangulifer]
MASNDDDNFGAKFEFQDFIHTTPQTNVAELDVVTSVKEKTAGPSTNNYQDGAGSATEDQNTAQAGPSFWSFDYYKQFFDVNTKQISDRVVYSMVPRSGQNYLETFIKPKADLYGPFWICITLVFTIAVSRNMVSYLQYEDKNYHWKYQFHTVSYAATAIFLYSWLLPLLVWASMWWQGGQNRISLLETLCVYGYSLAIFIPTSVLWVIQVGWLQWILLGVAVGLSGTVLLSSIWPAAQDASRALAFPLTIIVLGLHVVMAVSFMIFFFHTTTTSDFSPTTATSTTTTVLEAVSKIVLNATKTKN